MPCADRMAGKFGDGGVDCADGGPFFYKGVPKTCEGNTMRKEQENKEQDNKEQENIVCAVSNTDDFAADGHEQAVCAALEQDNKLSQESEGCAPPERNDKPSQETEECAAPERGDRSLQERAACASPQQGEGLSQETEAHVFSGRVDRALQEREENAPSLSGSCADLKRTGVDPSAKNFLSGEDADRQEKEAVGFIDSVYCGSGVDGKGLRCVVFFSGCNLRCPFCHNPETLFKRGECTDVATLVSRLERYKGYFRRGGVTLSGGEPFLQRGFALALVSALHAKGIRCCFETNGHIVDSALISAAEYLIVDVKNQETDDLSAYERFFAECVRQGKEVRVTNVLVPGKNDGEEKVRALSALARKYFPQGGVRFLPFRKLCEQKYAELSLPFPYAAIRECEPEDVIAAEKFL